MPRINIYEHSETYSFQVKNKSYACIAFPITAIWGPAYDSDEDLNPDWIRFPAGYRGTTDFVNTFRGPNTTLGARDKSYDYALKLLSSGYDILVKRADGFGQKAYNSIMVDNKDVFYIVAKYAGSFGNQLKVRITKSGSMGVVEVFDRNHYEGNVNSIVRTDQLLERVPVSLSIESVTDSCPYITEAEFSTLSYISLKNVVNLNSIPDGVWVVSLANGTDCPPKENLISPESRYPGIPLPQNMTIPENLNPDESDNKRIYYFKAPDDWFDNKSYKNEGFDIGFYITDDAIGEWPGIPAKSLLSYQQNLYMKTHGLTSIKDIPADVQNSLYSKFHNVYYATCKHDVPTVIWNNGVDGRFPNEHPEKFKRALQTTNVNVTETTINKIKITDLCGCLATEVSRNIETNDFTNITKPVSQVAWCYFDPRTGLTSTEQWGTDAEKAEEDYDVNKANPFYDMNYAYEYSSETAGSLNNLAYTIQKMLMQRFSSSGSFNYYRYFDMCIAEGTLTDDNLVQMWNQQMVFQNAETMLDELTDPLLYDWDAVFMGIGDDQYVPTYWKEQHPEVEFQYEATSAHLKLLQVASQSKCGAALIGTPFGMKRGVYNQITGLKIGAVAFKDSLSALAGPTLSTYGEVVGPWCRTTLPVNGANSWITPEVAHLLLIINANGVGGQNKWWMVPAGMVGTGVVHSPEYKIKKAYLDVIQNHDSGVCMNPLMQVPGKGFTCFGNSTLWDKPLGTYNALQNLSTRFLTNRVKQRIWDTALQILFKYNNENAYSHFYAGVSPLLDEMKSVGALESTEANPLGYRIVMNPDIINLDRINANTVIGRVELAITGVIDTVDVDLFLLPPTAFQTEA